MSRNTIRQLGRITTTAIFAACMTASSARAVILLGTGDPGANTTAPTGDLANSGWQFQGIFGAFLGTPISPDAFITAAHIGGDLGSTFVYQGITHNLTEQWHDPYSDLTIWKVTGSFSTFAPLFSNSAEAGQRLVVFGRGTQRGAQVVNGTPRGWLWGGGDGVQRWGENFVTSIVRGGPVNQYLYATFDATGSPNEAQLSVGDSGGAVFVQEGGVWKLAGINYAVDGPLFTTPTGDGAFNAALFDARGYYYQDENDPSQYNLIAGPNPVPTGFYATRISSKLPWIRSVIDPNGDANGNGVSDLVDFALTLNAPDPSGPGAPTLVKEPGAFSIVYRKLLIANGPQYAVQKSNDALSWTTVTPSETVLAVNGNVQTIKAQVAASGSRLFLRVQISPPLP